MTESNSGFARLEDTTRGSQVVLTRRRRYSKRVYTVKPPHIYLINLAIEKAVGARRSEGSHRSVQRQNVRLRIRRDNEPSDPYRRIRDVLNGLNYLNESSSRFGLMSRI